MVSRSPTPRQRRVRHAPRLLFESACSTLMMVLVAVCAGEPVSVSVGSDDSTLHLSQLSPGSSYEVSVISVLGLDESDPTKDLVVTRKCRRFSFSLNLNLHVFLLLVIWSLS